MRSLTLAMVAALVGLAAACSRAKPTAGDQLDLVLPDGGGPARVASALEIWGKAKPTPAAPAQHSSVSAPRHAPRRTPARHHPPRLVRAPVRAPVPLGRVAAAPAPAPVPEPAAAPAPDPAPAPQPTAQPQQGHGSGGLGGILRGIGGVIIIRGGYGGMDPCDERGHGMGRGMPMPLPMPGHGGRGFPGGVVFLRGR